VSGVNLERTVVMSKATQRHCAGTVQSHRGRVGNVKQVGFEPGPEDSYRRCGSDKIRQTVPDASSGKARSPTVDSRVRLTISDEDELKSLTEIVITDLRKCLPSISCPCRPTIV